jgi:release factor glutamine methyltransferase
MTLGRAMAERARTLTASETPALDALVLLEWVTQRRRDDLLVDYPLSLEQALTADELARLDRAIETRRSGLPVAYITGVREFWGRPFGVGAGVLIPRPESEQVVERALAFAREWVASPTSGNQLNVVDCCCGTGCIGIAVAGAVQELGIAVTLTLIDIDETACGWSERNARALLGDPDDTVSWRVLQGDLLAPLTAEHDSGELAVDLVLANPPYVATDELAAIEAKGWREPRRALDGGADGLALYRPLLAQAQSIVRPGGLVVVEHGYQQATAVADLFSSLNFSDILGERDLAGHPRITSGTVETTRKR